MSHLKRLVYLLGIQWGVQWGVSIVDGKGNVPLRVFFLSSSITFSLSLVYLLIFVCVPV